MCSETKLPEPTIQEFIKAAEQIDPELTLQSAEEALVLDNEALELLEK